MARKRTARMKPLSKTETLFTPTPQSARANELSTLKAIDLLEFNGRAEQEFVKITKEYIEQEGAQSIRSILAETAFELNISIETAKRYLLKHTARRAEFVITNGKVELR